MSIDLQWFRTTGEAPRIGAAPGVSFWSSIPERLRRRMSGGDYRAEIDGLRFFAIAIVVVGHFGERAVRFFPSAEAAAGEHPLIGSLLQRPGLGVSLFFAISGFIIATQAMKAKHGPLSAKFLRAYFGRRVLRIEPPYLILLVATWALLTFSGYTPEGTRQFEKGPESLTVSLLSSVFYLHDLLWGAFPRLFPPGWSLEVEVQFYLLAPLLFWAYFGLRVGLPRLLFGSSLLVAGASLAVFAPKQLGPASIDYSILRYFHFFWLGIMLADLQDWMAAKTLRVSPAAIGLLGWSAFFCYVVIPTAPLDPATTREVILALLVRVASLTTIAAMFFCIFGPRSSFKSFCANPWVSLVGGACYSIYLTHLQIIQVLTTMIARRAPDSALSTILVYAGVEIVAVVAIGLVFYALIERTFMIANWPRPVLDWIAKRGRIAREHAMKFKRSVRLGAPPFPKGGFNPAKPRRARGVRAEKAAPIPTDEPKRGDP